MHLAEGGSLITHVVSLNNWFICLRAASSLNLASSFVASPTVRLWQLNVIITSSHLCLIVHTWDFIRYFKDAQSLCSCTLVVILSRFANAFTLVGHCRGGGVRRDCSISLQHLNCVCYCFHRNMPVTFQALSERERKLWMEAMDGKEPVSLFFICTRLCFSSLTEGLAQTHTFNFQTPLLNLKF